MRILITIFALLPILAFGQTTSSDKYRHSQVILSDEYGNLDAFGRLRVSQATPLFDGQLTHDLQPLLYHIDTSATATITYDADNNLAIMALSSAASGTAATMQTYENFRYQAGKSHYAAITFNFRSSEAGVVKSVGYTDGENGMLVGLDSDGFFVAILSTTDLGNDTIRQDDWNLDKLDGSKSRSNPSKFTLVENSTNIFVIDMQALYVGRVRFGFAIDGDNIYVHEIDHANREIYPYIASASLPIRAKIEATSNDVSSDMYMICATVATEGGLESPLGFGLSQSGTVTAGSGARTHAITIGKVDTFQNSKCYGKIEIQDLEILVTGTNPVKWELVIGQELTGTTTFTAVNEENSIAEYNTAGTLSGNPRVVIASGYVLASGAQRGAVARSAFVKYPLERNPDTTARADGRLTLLVTGLGGASACQYAVNWKEIR